MQDVENQLDLHQTLQGRRKKILAEISLVSLDLEAAQSAFESAESHLTSVRTRDLDLLKDLQQVTLEMWRIEWKIGRSLDSGDRPSVDDGRCALVSGQHDEDIVLYDFHGDFPPGTIGTFFSLEGKQVGKDIMFAEEADGRYMVIDSEVSEERGRRALTLHLARIR